MQQLHLPLAVFNFIEVLITSETIENNYTMINSELLKEAIADAKAVRVTAYANARASLQERFDKRFEAVFADKLKNEAQEEEEEGLQEVEAPNQVSGKGGEAKGPKTKAVSKGQPKKVSDASTNWKVVGVGGAEGAAGSKAPRADVGIDENTEEDEDKKMDEQYEEEKEAKMDESGFSSEDLDEIIKELEAEVAGEEKGQRIEEPSFPPRPNADANAADAEAGDADVAAGEADAEAGDAHHDAEEADAEAGDAHDAAEMPGAGAGEDMEAGEADALAGDAHDSAGEADAEAGEAHHDAGEADAEAGEADALAGDADMGGQVPPQFGKQNVPPQMPPQFPQRGAEDQEEINLEELLAALNEDSEEEEDEDKKMDEISNNGLPKNVGGADKTGGTNVYPKGPDASKKQLPGKNHNIQGHGNIGTGATGGKPLHEVEKYKTALKESYKTIEFLRGQINEVNLLNAKLLYTNKLFKEFATVIDEPYRMKIVEAFDLTKTVREVKLAYALLAESLNFGSKRTIAFPMKSASKVDPARRAIVRQITEGQASKPVASTKPSQSVITESAGIMVSRLQKLAGIKKPSDSKK